MADTQQARPLTDAALAGDANAQAQLHDFLLDAGYAPGLVESMIAGIQILSASAHRCVGFGIDYRRALAAGIIEPVLLHVEPDGWLSHILDLIRVVAMPNAVSLGPDHDFGGPGYLFEHKPGWRPVGPVLAALSAPGVMSHSTMWWLGREQAERLLDYTIGCLAAAPILLPPLPEGVYWDVWVTGRPCLVSVSPHLLAHDGYRGPLPPARHIPFAFC